MAEKQVRLDKWIAETAELTRKESKNALNKGRVTVDGKVCKEGEKKVSEENRICLDGVRLQKAEKFLYLMMNKPAGVISATEDSREKTVLELVDCNRNLFPVGRLDKDTEGFLLLTDNGELAHRLLSPKRHVDKVYYAKVAGIVPEDAVQRFEEGIMVGKEYKALPAGLKVLGRSEQEQCSEIEVTLQEGKFHQVKRMCHEIGCEVTYLKRISMAGITLDEKLLPGMYRKLTEQEVSMFYKAAGMTENQGEIDQGGR